MAVENETNEFLLDPDLSMDLEELSNRLFQRQLRDSYQQLYFDPIQEFLTKD